ncbi:MAG TPA: SLBB domain-containing protein [Bacteroidota bacterium]|nr:SLBB domain-containing protein [Bacteroidota bacterium]
MLKLKFSISILLLLSGLSSLGVSQTREQIQSAVESGRRMSPEEITQKLREMGLTLEEAGRRARDLNVNLEEYINLTTLSATQANEALAPFLPQRGMGGDTLALTQRDPLQQILQRDSLRKAIAAQKRLRVLEVPGFSQRESVELHLQPYGYEAFQYPVSLFEPVLNVATPPSYLLGPGDEIVISVWGETKLYYQLVVNREGNILIPDVGPVNAMGSTIQQFRDKLVRRMTAVYSGLRNGGPGANTFLDVSLGRLRTIQIFVLGDVERPGGYQVSSMSTAFHALYLAGGPAVTGTLREIRIVRPGFNLPPTDLYDYLLRGNRTNDIRLQDGDVVFVKPAGKRAAIQGRVVRPAIYELKENETLADLLALAGGLRFDAYVNRVHVERIVPFDQRSLIGKTIQDIDLRFEKLRDLLSSKFALEDGDVITVREITELPENRVVITGNVKKPGPYQLKPGMRVKDLIMAADSLERNTFSERGTLFRLLPNLRREILAFNPRLALEGDEAHDLQLANEDSLVIYKESQFFPQRVVSIAGAVRKPGIFPRHEKMNVADLVVLAGGLKEEAITKGWEISRIETTSVGVFTRVFKVDVDHEYWTGKGGGGFLLHDLDHVLVPTDPRITPPQIVDVSGYVMFPGKYTIRYEGEKLSELLKRAGGPREGAYLAGSRLFRKANNAGLVPIDFEEALDDTTSLDNIELLDGDSISIAKHEDLVYVRGEVFVPSPVLYKKGASLKYYILQAGDFKEEADIDRVVVFLPSGKKWEPGGLFGDPEILPGSAIYVPRKIEKEDKTLPILRDLATILASLAAITIGIIQVTK